MGSLEKKDKTHDQYLEDLELSDNIYLDDVREALLANDELSPIEEAFMRGYEEATKSGGDIMQKKGCISCGHIILKSALHDPHVCRDCEDLMMDPEERYDYLDRKI